MVHPRNFRAVLHVQCHAVDRVLYHRQRNHQVLQRAKLLRRLDVDDIYAYVHPVRLPGFLVDR